MKTFISVFAAVLLAGALLLAYQKCDSSKQAEQHEIKVRSQAEHDALVNATVRLTEEATIAIMSAKKDPERRRELEFALGKAAALESDPRTSPSDKARLSSVSLRAQVALNISGR